MIFAQFAICIAAMFQVVLALPMYQQPVVETQQTIRRLESPMDSNLGTGLTSGGIVESQETLRQIGGYGGAGYNGMSSGQMPLVNRFRRMLHNSIARNNVGVIAETIMRPEESIGVEVARVNSVKNHLHMLP